MSLGEASRICSAAKPLRRLTSVDQIDAAVEQSHIRSVLIFKHSVTCGRSAQAYDELMDSLRNSRSVIAYLVCVQADFAVSTAIAQRFGIRHESPQLLILADAQVRWTASHFHLNASAIQRALNQLAQAQ